LAEFTGGSHIKQYNSGLLRFRRKILHIHICYGMGVGRTPTKNENSYSQKAQADDVSLFHDFSPDL